MVELPVLVRSALVRIQVPQPLQDHIKKSFLYVVISFLLSVIAVSAMEIQLGDHPPQKRLRELDVEEGAPPLKRLKRYESQEVRDSCAKAKTGDKDSRSFVIDFILETGNFDLLTFRELSEILEIGEKPLKIEDFTDKEIFLILYHNIDLVKLEKLEAFVEFVFEKNVLLGKEAPEYLSLAVAHVRLNDIKGGFYKDLDEGFRILRFLEEQGSFYGKYFLSLWRYKGCEDIEPVNVRAAFCGWDFLAKKKFIPAMSRLALCFSEDNSACNKPSVRNQKAFDLWLEASAYGSSEAKYHLAQKYLDGFFGVIDKDNGRCLKFLIEAEDLGNVKALYLLADFYISGFDGIPVDQNKAFRLHVLAAERGYEASKKFLRSNFKVNFHYSIYKFKNLPQVQEQIKNLETRIYDYYTKFGIYRDFNNGKRHESSVRNTDLVPMKWLFEATEYLMVYFSQMAKILHFIHDVNNIKEGFLIDCIQFKKLKSSHQITLGEKISSDFHDWIQNENTDYYRKVLKSHFSNASVVNVFIEKLKLKMMGLQTDFSLGMEERKKQMDHMQTCVDHYSPLGVLLQTGEELVDDFYTLLHNTQEYRNHIFKEFSPLWKIIDSAKKRWDFFD